MSKRKEPKPKPKYAPTKVPSHYLKSKPDPLKTVQTMNVGETKYIAQTDFMVDTDHGGWINPDALVADEISKRHPVGVERDQKGYVVGLVYAFETCNEKWEHTLDQASFVEKGWIAVCKVF
jgi:hypothetical protein